MKTRFAILFFLAFLVFGCASNEIIEKTEYQAVTENLKTDNIEMALAKFPKKEQHHFVTLLEKVYLQLLNTDNLNTANSNEFEELLAESRAIEKNERTSIGNELDQLFFIKTNEGYYPANHEIFWMHLILGMTFVKNKQINRARVEAKRISELFARVDMQGRPFYDNSGIRMLAAALWVMCGEKDSALVDLRSLKKEFPDLVGASETETINWEIILKGTGYVADMDTSTFNSKFNGFKSIRFRSSVPEKEMTLVRATSPSTVFSTRLWHSENLVRNEEFKDTIQKSKYMSRMFKSEVEYQSLNLLTSIAAGTVMVTGIALGVGIVGGSIYLAASAGGAGSGEVLGYLFAAGILVGTEVYQAGSNFYTATQNKIQNERHEFQDASRYYRYVRFIPDYFLLNKLAASDEAKLITKPKTYQSPVLQTENSSGKIRVLFQP